jgi:polyphosphate kinase 2 (PPK2 family)
MFDQLDLSVVVSKREYRRQLPEFQARLFDMEQAVIEARLPVVLVFEGWAGTSRARLIGALTRRLDPRGLRVYAGTPPRTFERQYPWLYRFWLKIPSYGRIAIFERAWYRQVIDERTRERGDAALWRSRCEDIASFERQLADDGAVILKFWLHIDRKEQRRRLEHLQADPLTAWQVSADDRWQNRNYPKVAATVEDLIARTDTDSAPWHIIPATDHRAARLAVFAHVLSALEARLGRPAVALDADAQSAGIDDSSLAFRRYTLSVHGGNGGNGAATQAAQTQPDGSPNGAPPVPAILDRLDLSARLDAATYKQQRKHLQAKLYLLGLEVYRQQRPVVLVFEGWDAAGKGGAIQRLTAKLDPRSNTVHAIAAPTGDDKARHYLYRFWRRLPPRGAIAIFDRSWYGRVLVERVEGFARPDEWQRAYAEINAFERQLVEFGTIICKFWLHLSPEEQLRRFEERQNVPYKTWKLTDEDWRNREKWPQYEAAANEMLLRTSTPTAPWTLVAADDKSFGRIAVLRTVVQRLEDELGRIAL